MGREDEIGTRGEAIFIAAIMNFCGRDRPYFIPHFLGEKFKTLDFLVELIGSRGGGGHLFVQVKTTSQGYATSSADVRLNVSLRRTDVVRMRTYPAPTYLVGVDEIEEKVYILSIDERTAGPISAMTTRYPLDCANLKVLWDEVDAYWKARDMRVKESAFSL